MENQQRGTQETPTDPDEILTGPSACIPQGLAHSWLESLIRGRADTGIGVIVSYMDESLGESWYSSYE